jgi:hypothetical protein
MMRMPEELDPRSLVGRPVKQAREIAERSGYVVQVIPADFGGITLDLMPGRIRLITEGDRVTDVILN